MWRELPLGNLATINSGGTPSTENAEFWGGEIPWVTPTDITACKTNYLFDTASQITKKGLHSCSAKLLPAGSILFTSRATVGVSRIAGIPVCTNQGFKSLTSGASADGKFLFYQVQRLRSAFERYAAGSTFPEINKKDTARVLIPHPADVRVQQKIATILSTIDTAIEQTEALIEKYQHIKAGLMHDLFTRGVLPNGQLRPPREQAPELYQETVIGWIPKEWTSHSLRQLVGSANVVNGPFGSDLLTSELKQEGIPVLYVQDVKAGFFRRVSNANVTPQKASQLAFCNVKNGDVLVAKVGAPPCDSCVYDLGDNAIVTQDVIRIRPTMGVNPHFIAAQLNTPFGRKAVKRISIEGTRERVSLTQFKDLVFPLAPIDEQNEIAVRLKNVQTRIEGEIKKCRKLKLEKLGLMQDLLTGKVAVTVDAPASEAVA